MDGMNKVYLIGNLGADPKIQKTKDGKAFCRLSLAVSRSWSFDIEGKSKRKTEWYNVMVWGGHGGYCAKYLKKGSLVMVDGYLSTYQAEALRTSDSSFESNLIDDTPTKVGEGPSIKPTHRPETKVAIHADKVKLLSEGRFRLSDEGFGTSPTGFDDADQARSVSEPAETNGIKPVIPNVRFPKSTVAH